MSQEQKVAGAAQALSVPVRRKMAQAEEDVYVSDDGFRMVREQGLTPNGNRIGGRWVLRGPQGEWIDVDQYRHDLMERHGFETA
jgi:hypothetical protein